MCNFYIEVEIVWKANMGDIINFETDYMLHSLF